MSAAAPSSTAPRSSGADQSETQAPAGSGVTREELTDLLHQFASDQKKAMAEMIANSKEDNSKQQPNQATPEPKKSTKDKSKANPPDPARAVPWDPLDPRAEGRPCNGSHLKIVSGSNQFSIWRDCAKCGLRLETIPRIGATSKYHQKTNPHHVDEAIQELESQNLLDSVDHKKFKAMLEIVAQRHKLQQGPTSKGASTSQKPPPPQRTTPGAGEAEACSTPKTPPPPSESAMDAESTASWSQVGSPTR